MSTAVAASSQSSPSAFLKLVIGRPVVIKINSGVVYKGVLACIDGTVMISLPQLCFCTLYRKDSSD